jgi:hypothetical protein
MEPVELRHAPHERERRRGTQQIGQIVGHGIADDSQV